jgi:CRP/FNR family transcriptional regulator, putaive post-exponential-phase nitrogen-starvation regulator
MEPYMELILFNKNEHICKASEKMNYLFFFVEGKAKVYTLLSNGKSLLLCFNKPFKVIGDVEFIHYKTADSDVQVIEDSYCVGIPLKDIRKYVIDDPKFLRFMCDCLGEKLTRLSKYSSINLLYPLDNRLSSYIVAISSSEQNEGENNIIFDGNLREISELLGTSYRHLLRTLNKLCNQGAIKKNNNHYEILNINILEDLAGELYE